MGFSALDLEVQFLGPLPTQPHTPQPLGLIPRKQRNSVDRETTEDEDGPSRSLPDSGAGTGRLLSRAGRPGVRPPSWVLGGGPGRGGLLSQSTETTLIRS